jgi:predicted transcriptional regulator
MDDHRPIILDLDDAERAQLSALAAHEQRSAEELATEAVRARLARHEAYLHAIDEGREAATEGRISSDEDVQARFLSMRERFLADRKH